MPVPTPDRENVPSPGDVIADKYVVEKVLGLGGMGMVLAASHMKLRQRVAIKLLLPEVLSSEEGQRRFLREARVAGGIQSEHVARVRDFGTLESGAPYLVMDYLEGRDLKRVITEHGRLSVADAVDYVLQACEALCEAHIAGIVHRDLKPANLFLTTYPDGSPLVKVLDFGISKAASFDSQARDGGLTRTDAVLGSPVYMSPEQIRSPRDVDQRADIWGIGVVLYELVTGLPPFDGDNVATLSARIVVDPPRPLREGCPDAPAGFEGVLLKCLAKEPSDRYASVPELARAIEPFAPEAARLSLRRIARLGMRAPAFDETVLAESAAGMTGAPLSRTVVTSSRRAMLAVALAALVSIVVAVFLTRNRFAPQVASAGAAPSAVPVASSSPAAVPAVAGPSTVSAGDAAPDPPSERAAPSALAAPSNLQPVITGPPRNNPAAKKCPPGETESNGHCCPMGLAWQKNHCERPLATKL